MKWIILTILGIAVGYLLGKRQRAGYVSEKQKKLNQIMEYLNSHDQIANDEVEKMLKVSDASAERYLDELEKQGKLVQVGKTGKHVIYRKK